jgi:hypothetical protein
MHALAMPTRDAHIAAGPTVPGAQRHAQGSIWNPVGNPFIAGIGCGVGDGGSGAAFGTVVGPGAGGGGVSPTWGGELSL